MQNFISNTPLWVWPLFIVLVAVGLRSAKDRKSPIWLFYFLPLLGIMSAVTVSGLPFPLLSWSVWVISWLAGSVIGFWLQRRWIIEKSGNFAQVRGEWMTLSMMMVLFFSNFVLGVIKSVSPGTVNDPLFLCLFLVVIGAASGSFMGRSVKMLRQ